MSAANSNLTQPLDLIQKTYLSQTVSLQANPLPEQHSSHARSSIAKASTNPPSRRNSVHDLHENLREDLNKILIAIQENLSKLKILLETMESFESIKEEFLQLKQLLLAKILDCIQKFSSHPGKRGSMTSTKSSPNMLGYYPQRIVYCIEYFRGELLKSIYLFSSLMFSTEIPVAVLNAIILNSADEEIRVNGGDQLHLQLIQSIQKDVNELEGHVYVLTQRYYSQIPDWQNLDGNLQELNNGHLKLVSSKEKLTHRSSSGSHEEVNLCTQLYRKCELLCCLCTNNSI